MRAKNYIDTKPIINCLVCGKESKSYHRACRTCNECKEAIVNRTLKVDNEEAAEIDYLNHVIKANQNIYHLSIKNHVQMALIELENFKKREQVIIF